MTVNAPSGSAPIIVAPTPTPFRSDGVVDLDGMSRNIAKWLETTLSGFVLNTENGEESFLSDAERADLIRVTHEARGDRLLVAGVDHPSTLETLRRAEQYIALGANMIRLRIPRMTDRLDDYFSEVLPRMPAPTILIHQMAPGMFLSNATQPAGSPEQIGGWVSMPNVEGYIASADLRFETRVRRFVPRDRQFWIGNGAIVLAGILLGANGGCMMLANLFPDQVRSIFDRSATGDLKQAHAIQQRLFDVDWEILSRRVAGIKAALVSRGFEMGEPRSPQSACNAESVRQIVAAIEAAIEAVTDQG